MTLPPEVLAELERLDKAVEPKALECRIIHASVGPRGGRIRVGDIAGVYQLHDSEFAYMTPDMARMLALARTHLPALLSAARMAEVYEREVEAWRHHESMRAGQARIIRSDQTARDVVALRAAANLVDEAELRLATARSATDAARGGGAVSEHTFNRIDELVAEIAALRERLETAESALAAANAALQESDERCEANDGDNASDDPGCYFD